MRVPTQFFVLNTKMTVTRLILQSYECKSLFLCVVTVTALLRFYHVNLEVCVLKNDYYS